MLVRARRWVTEQTEYVVLGVSLSVIATLVAWWAVFVRRMIGSVQALGTELVLLQGRPADLAEIEARSARMELMLRGESLMFALALVTSVVVLFVLVRRHRQARDRMERLLQFTSHELKTPIAGVRALLQTLARNRVPEELRVGLLDEGVAACDRLEHLAETILAYQRAVASDGHRSVVASAHLLQGVLAHRSRTLHDEALLVHDHASAMLCVDTDGFRVVMENLLDNARKYGGGRVDVRTSIVGATWCVAVHDEGAGFAPGDAERFFEPFARGEASGEAVTHGSGLGLYLSRQLARRWGGDLGAASDGTGRGAVFTVSVPLAEGGTAGGVRDGG